ncbi:MAG: hypothetical protein DWQ36_18830 [Acidobacteria bacterium]|nr:MAG: hypothetical protein DWQ30_03610 [Acidobacteriota bacterium]REK03829.1 MAG: hypothetical protein DWQ36_18830 [Acidobacteriota bacterium]
MALGIVITAGCRGGPADEPILVLDETGASLSGAALVGLPLDGDGFVAAEDPRELAAVLAVYTGQPPAPEPGGTGGCLHPDGQPTILGRWSRHEDELRFTPRFAFVGGVDYWACVDLARLAQTRGSPRSAAGGRREAGSRRLVATLSMPAAPAAAPQVSSVWPPPGQRVPANLLRVYVHFSRPMQPRDVARSVVLRDDAGRPLPLPFVDIPDGLWDAERRRLTLFLDPGRIKRGVGPNRELGPVLEPGRRYELEIGPPLRSVDGEELATHRHRFETGDVDRDPPHPGTWVLVPPAEGDSPLEVRFDDLLDPEIARRMLTVTDMRGELVAGDAETTPGGDHWSFTPRRPWRPGSYVLVVPPAIEDLAGNAVGRRFDVATGDTGPAAASEVVAPTRPEGDRLAFRVGPPAD